jgi:hypothetical protein
MNDRIKPTCDRKTRFYDSQQNTFGLMPGRLGSCPGCTIGRGGCCEILPGRKTPTCYVNKTLSYSKAAKNVLQANTDLLKGSTEDQMFGILCAEFSRFALKETKRPSPSPWSKYYRLHWSGDIFSVTYAKALKRAMTVYPEIQFWNYTRSFFALKHLVGVPNLMQYLSLDAVNFDKGMEAYTRWCGEFGGRLSVCLMGTADLAEKLKVALPQTQDCPADVGLLPIDGACRQCQKCLRGIPIWFKTK